MQEAKDSAAIVGTVTQPEALTFSQALDWMKEGKRVARKAWKSEQFIVAAKYNEKVAQFTQFELHQEGGAVYAGKLIATDILAEDWVVVEED